MNACETVFPQSVVNCCFFHLSQNIYREVQENHLQNVYDDVNNDFRTHVKMISALAFVLPQDIFRAFDLLCVQFGGVGTNEQIILDYFERTYVGAVVAGVRAPPIFYHSLWNV